MTDITNIIEVIITIIAIIMSAIVIPLIKSKLNNIVLNNDKSALAVAQGWLEIAVQAAEEAARTGLISKSAKFSYVVAILEKQGITFDDKTTEALINSKVWELFNQFKEEENGVDDNTNG